MEKQNAIIARIKKTLKVKFKAIRLRGESIGTESNKSM